MKSTSGGGRGIRTPEGREPQHAFQACALNHSAIPPSKNYTLKVIAYKIKIVLIFTLMNF